MAVFLIDVDDLSEFYPFSGELNICTPLEDHQKKVVSEHLKIQQSNLKVIFSNNLSVQDVKRLSKSVKIDSEFKEKIYKAAVVENIKAAMYELKREAKAPEFDDVPDPEDVPQQVEPFKPSFIGNF